MKTVNEKINDFINKEVHRLEKRVADLHEKYPEDGFGCKADDMCWEYEEQIEQCRQLLECKTQIEQLKKDLMNERSNYIKLRTRILDYARDSLPSWDVERIKSIIETIENSRKDFENGKRKNNQEN